MNYAANHHGNSSWDQRFTFTLHEENCLTSASGNGDDASRHIATAADKD